MSSAYLLPINNPNVDTRSDQERWTQIVNDKLFNRKPKNVPMVVNQRFGSEKIVNGLIGQISDPMNNISTGIWGIGRFAENRVYLQSPARYKLNNVNDINMITNVGFVQLVNFSTAPTPTGDYTVYLYVVLQRLFTGLDVTVDPYLVLRYEFKYEQTPVERFYFTNPTIEVRMRDTVTRETIRAFSADYPNFLTNPDKITLEQYNEFAGQDVQLISGWGFDIGQLGGSTLTPNPVLSANNKTHFEYFLFGNAGAFDGFTYFDIDIQHVITYSGTYAEFVPLD